MNKPQELHFELTYRCNSKCIMCNLWFKKKQKEVTLKEIKDFVNSSKLLQNIKVVVLSGGEPFLREDFIDIYSFFIDKYEDIKIGILTNFLNKNLVLKKLKNILKTDKSKKSTWLSSSLDGIDDAYDKIRGTKNGYKKVLETYKTVRKEFPYIPITFTFTLFPKNVDQILPVYFASKKMGLNVAYQIFVQKKETEQFLWKKDNIKTVEEQLRFIPDFPLKKYFIEYLKKPKRFSRICKSVYKYVMVNPEGYIYVCPVYKDIYIGNIRNNNFDEIWNNEKSEGIKEKLSKGNCHCFLCCTIGDFIYT